MSKIKLTLNAALAAIAALSFWPTLSFAAPTSFSNPAAITIIDCPNPCGSGRAASLYPSPITVSGLTGVVERVSITLNGYSHAFPADADFLLVSPSGRKSVLMSDFGAGSPGVSNINVTLDDYAARPVPSSVVGNTGVPFVSGNYRPANSGTTETFAAPAPAGPYAYTLSAFNGDDPNGVWNLYIIDDANLDGGAVSGGWTISFDERPAGPAPGDVLISEFRTRGLGTSPPASGGSADEFIELYNNTDESITLIDAIPGADPTSSTGAGWRISAAQGGAESDFFLLPQTASDAGPIAIAPRSHLLLTTQPTTPNPAGNTYSLFDYPTGTNINTPSGAANFLIDPASASNGFLPDDGGIAVFSSITASSAQRLDSVGFSAISNADYKEGAGLGPATGITTASNHSWVRRALASGYPQDSGNNAADFVLVDTTGAVLDGVPAILGAPGPERGHSTGVFTQSSAPMHQLAGTLQSSPMDPDQPYNGAPNQIRDLAPVANGASGTLKIRRRYTNLSGERFISLRFRVIGLSTLTGGAVASGAADLRLLNSAAQTLTLTDSSTVNTLALDLQTPPAQAGGGLNSSVSVTTITPTQPLNNNGSVVVEFNLGVQTEGAYRFVIMAEGLPGDGLGGASAVDTFPIPDLAISKTDGFTTVTAGDVVSYMITASNIGDAAVSGATVTDTLPASLSNASWVCAGTNGGSCTASGTGSISDPAVNLPLGASVTYTLSATLDVTATGTLANTATIAVPAGLVDLNTTNNSATDTNTVNAVTVPGAPTITSAGLTGGGQVNVIFTAPTSNGGAAISNYEYAFNGDTVFTALNPLDATSPLSLPVPNGVTVTSVRIRAVNIAGAGAESADVSVSPAPTPTPTPTQPPTPTPVPTAVPTATPTPFPTATPTATPTPSATPTAVPTATPTAAPTATPTAVPSATPTPTPSSPPDSDDVPTGVERRVPDLDGSGRGDGNGDGVMDARQSDVASLETAAGNRFITLISGSGSRMTGVSAQALPDNLPADVDTPSGAIMLRLVGMLPGEAGQLELLLTADGETSLNGVLALNRVTGDYAPVAFGAGIRGEDRERLSLALIDGGPFDADGAANGTLELSLIPAALPSADNDGAPDRTEARAPDLGGVGRGDGNGDGVADAEQGNVASMPLATGRGFLTLSTTDALRLSVIEAVYPPESIDPALDLPYAGLSFVATGLNPGATAQFDLYLPENAAVNGLLKRNRETGEYVDIVDTVRQLPGQATVLRFRIEDGGPFDADGAANGTIVDPAFPAIVDGKTPRPVSGSSGGAIGLYEMLLLVLMWMIGSVVTAMASRRAP